MIKRVVLPIDFSARNNGAVHYVEALARYFQAELKILHVLPPPHYEALSLEVSGPVLADVLAGRETHAKKQLAEFLAAELEPYNVERVLLEGDPATRIVEYANQVEADLIVMPTHGYGPFRRFILGSVTAKVLHDARCPVLTGVHMEEAPSFDRIDFKRILVAVDLEEGSERALQWAAGAAKTMGARLIITNVQPTLEGHTGAYFDPEWRRYFTESAKERIDAMLASTGTSAEVVITFGEPAKQVAEVAMAEKADLVVIGHNHDSGVLGRLRTHAYAIVRTSPCPVVSV
jgi:nucleotide-binding universal stress UspA family protein